MRPSLAPAAHPASSPAGGLQGGDALARVRAPLLVPVVRGDCEGRCTPVPTLRGGGDKASPLHRTPLGAAPSPLSPLSTGVRAGFAGARLWQEHLGVCHPWRCLVCDQLLPWQLPKSLVQGANPWKQASHGGAVLDLQGLIDASEALVPSWCRAALAQRSPGITRGCAGSDRGRGPQDVELPLEVHSRLNCLNFTEALAAGLRSARSHSVCRMKGSGGAGRTSLPAPALAHRFRVLLLC